MLTGQNWSANGLVDISDWFWCRQPLARVHGVPEGTIVYGVRFAVRAVDEVRRLLPLAACGLWWLCRPAPAAIAMLMTTLAPVPVFGIAGGLAARLDDQDLG